jgi:hypothetical protein
MWGRVDPESTRLCPCHVQPRLTVVRKHASGGSGGNSGGGAAVGTPPEGSLGSSWSRGASPPGECPCPLHARMSPRPSPHAPPPDHHEDRASAEYVGIRVCLLPMTADAPCYFWHRLEPCRRCAGTAADGDLPSVMTCANYIKLPPYSSFQVRRPQQPVMRASDGVHSAPCNAQTPLQTCPRGSLMYVLRLRGRTCVHLPAWLPGWKGITCLAPLQVCQERVLFAIREGQGSFDLS